MDVVHGRRSLEPGIYEAWTEVLRTGIRALPSPAPVRHSLPGSAFAATADRLTAELIGPGVIA